MEELVFFGAGFLCIGGFFGWLMWLTDPRHPERLDRMSREVAVRPPKSRKE